MRSTSLNRHRGDVPALRAQAKLYFLASAALLAGLIFYTDIRPGGWWDRGIPPGWLNALPSLVHVYGFILLSATACWTDKRRWPYLCLFWLGLSGLLEILQAEPIASKLVQWLSTETPLLPATALARRYLSAGTFAVSDLLATAVGTACAWYTLRRTAASNRLREQ